MAFTSAAVHAMVMAGCFGDQGCLWVAVSYLGVRADIAAEFDCGWAAAYDLAIRFKGERDPTFTAVEAPPLHRELPTMPIMPTMLDLKMRLTPPAHRSSSSGPAAADYAEQEPAGPAYKRKRGSRHPGKVDSSAYNQERLKPFVNPFGGAVPSPHAPAPPGGARGQREGQRGQRRW